MKEPTIDDMLEWVSDPDRHGKHWYRFETEAISAAICEVLKQHREMRQSEFGDVTCPKCGAGYGKHAWSSRSKG
jgi:protein-arginine kinase activator protein McsA